MKLEECIRKNYGLDIVSITKNEDSSDGNVYNIKTSNNKYIAKIYNDLNKANNMINLHNHLKSLHIPRIITTKDKEELLKFNNEYIVIYSFLEGKQVSTYLQENNNIFYKSIIKLIAKELRKFHDITLNTTLNLQQLEFANNLERKSILHFDLTKENIFINDNTVGFIDFDDAKYGDSICDIAILLSFLFISKKKGIDKENIKIFLDNYYKENEEELRKKELHYIKLYIKEWVDYVLNGHEFDSSLKDSFLFKKISTENLDI